MQVYRRAKKFDDVIYETPSKKDIPINNWKILDDGLTKIENEWKNRIIIEKHVKEFIKERSRIIEEIDDFTVEELKCWFSLLRTKFNKKYENGDFYSKDIDEFYYTKINIIYWKWIHDGIEDRLLDIYFIIENEYNDKDEQHGAIFLHNEVVIINSNKSLHKTEKISIELEKRIDALKLIRH